MFRPFSTVLYVTGFIQGRCVKTTSAARRVTAAGLCRRVVEYDLPKRGSRTARQFAGTETRSLGGIQMCAHTIVRILAAVLLCVPLQAALQIVTEQEYAEAMREINFIVSDAGLHIESRYWPELSEDLGKLRSQFEQVEAFWTARDAEEAAAFARAVIDGIEPLAAAGADQDVQAAMGALRTLRDVCQACHGEFREENADGSYRIGP